MSARSLTTNQREGIVRTIRGLANSAFEAASKLDVGRFHSYFSNTNLCVINGMVIPSWDAHREEVRAWFSSLREARYNQDEARVEVLTPDVAVWVRTWTFRGVDKAGSETTAAGAQTWVFAHQDDEWRIVHSHLSEPGGKYGPYVE